MQLRRLLPVAVLIASALVFAGAILYALRPASPTPRSPAAVLAVGPASPAATALAPGVPAAAAPSLATAASAPATPTGTPVPTSTAPVAVAGETPSSASATAEVIATTVRPASPTGTAAPPTAVPSTRPPVAAAPSSGPPASPTPTVAPPPTPTPGPPAAPLPAPSAPTATPRPVPPAAPAAAPVGAAGVPVRLLIPSIGVDAAVEQVATDSEGNMATPADPWNTAWYAPGSRPGEPGNAAIAGHVDYRGIGAVVFWELRTLSPGDEVLVVTDSGLMLRFTVRDSAYFRPENAPLAAIFGPSAGANLNLITCGGTFNPSTRQYDQRLVVFTTFAGVR